MNRITLNKNNKNQDVVSIYKKKFFNKENNKEEVVDNHLVANELGFNNFNSDFKLNFLNPSSLSNDIVSLVKDDYKVVFKLIGKKENNLTQLNKIKAKLINDYKVIYEDIFTDSSIEYEILDDKKIKENIIIKNNNKNEYVYEYEIEINNLQVKLSDDGNELLFVNKDNEAIFKMLSPIMNDANNNTSEDITYTINKIDDNKYQLLINASASWINSSERALPIYIDPTIEVLAVNSNKFVDWYIFKDNRLFYRADAKAELEDQKLSFIVNDNILSKYGSFKIKLGLDLIVYEHPITLYMFKKENILKEKNANDIITIDTFNTLKRSAKFVSIKFDRLYDDSIILDLYSYLKEGYEVFVIDNSYNLTIHNYDATYLVSYERCLNAFPVCDSYKKDIQLTNNIIVNKNLVDQRFSLNIIESKSIGNLSLIHSFSTDDYLLPADKTNYFKQYGNNYRINYSIVIVENYYANKANNQDDLSIHTYTMIDSNNNLTNFEKDDSDNNYYLSNDITKETKLIKDGNNIFVENKTSKMTFSYVNIGNSKAYFLKEIKSLVNDDKITINYQENNKTLIDGIGDNKGNVMFFYYDINNMLEEININNKLYKEKK